MFNYTLLGVKPPKNLDFSQLDKFRPLTPTPNGPLYPIYTPPSTSSNGGVSNTRPGNGEVVVGKSAYELAVDNGFTGTLQDWLSSLHGQDGLSAYGVAVASGFEGTREEWLASLVGRTPDGEPLTPKNGKNAYELAVDNGYTGSQEQWLESLKGVQGLSAYDLAVENGYEGSKVQWLNSLHGQDGKSAYQIAVDLGQFNGTVEEWIDVISTPIHGDSAYQVAVNNGFDGTEEQWLQSLRGLNGIDGVNGKSAYQIAVEDGFEGSREEWLDSLKVVTVIDDNEVETIPVPGKMGPAGLSAYQIAVQNGFEGTEEEWLNYLKGTDGRSAYDYARENGFTGSVTQWLESLKGKDGLNGQDGETGLSAYELAVQNGFEGDIFQWIEYLKGAAGKDGAEGPKGDDGLDGLSAYQLAVNEGFQGDQTQWLESLKGAKGDKGDTGEAGKDGLNGEPGSDGVNGKSAYELAVENGYEKSEIEWLAELSAEDGTDGLSAYQTAVNYGFEGTEEEWLNSLKGDRGFSAYEIASQEGYTGSREEWLETLKAKDGTDGLSAYDIAVINGFEGSLEEWVASLKGDTGATGKSFEPITVEVSESGVDYRCAGVIDNNYVKYRFVKNNCWYIEECAELQSDTSGITPLITGMNWSASIGLAETSDFLSGGNHGHETTESELLLVDGIIKNLTEPFTSPVKESCLYQRSSIMNQDDSTKICDKFIKYSVADGSVRIEQELTFPEAVTLSTLNLNVIPVLRRTQVTNSTPVSDKEVRTSDMAVTDISNKDYERRVKTPTSGEAIILSTEEGGISTTVTINSVEGADNALVYVEPGEFTNSVYISGIPLDGEHEIAAGTVIKTDITVHVKTLN